MSIAITPFAALKKLLKKAGSQSALARALGVRQPTVWHWLNVLKRLPAEHVLKAEEIYGVSRHDLDPRMYPRNYPASNEFLTADRSRDGSNETAAHRLSGVAK